MKSEMQIHLAAKACLHRGIFATVVKHNLVLLSISFHLQVVQPLRQRTVQSLGCGWGSQAQHQSLVSLCVVLVSRALKVAADTLPWFIDSSAVTQQVQ